MRFFRNLLPGLIGAAIAIPSIAGAQSLRATSPDEGETRKTAASIAGTQMDSATTVRVLVPCPVGSPADIFARRLAQLLSESSDQQFYVENVPSGAVNAASAKQMQEDGRTVFFLSADPTQPSVCGD
jgi:hypothetical protein